MNRKQFLSSAALITALAFGKKTKAEKSKAERIWYASNRIEYKNMFYEFTVDLMPENWLEENASYQIEIANYNYNNMVESSDYFHEGTGDSTFNKLGKTKILKSGYKMEFEAERIYFSLPKNFYPSKLILSVSADKSSMSFDLNGGRTVKLTPIKDGKSSSDDMDCFLTTACIRAKQLPDDCTELTALRNFRDTALIATSEGKNLVKKYYNIAPQIVQEINTYSNSSEIWTLLYEELVQGTVNLIDDNKAADAVNLYSSYVNLLEENVLAKN